MGLGITLLVLSLILVAFLITTRYEARSGTRFFAPLRNALDGRVAHVYSTFTHTPPTRVLVDVAKYTMIRLVHEVAHIALTAVRVVERALVRVVHRVSEQKHDAAEKKEIE